MGGRLAGAAARGHRADDLRPRLRHLGGPLPRGRVRGRRGGGAPLPGARAARPPALQPLVRGGGARRARRARAGALDARAGTPRARTARSPGPRGRRIRCRPLRAVPLRHDLGGAPAGRRSLADDPGPPRRAPGGLPDHGPHVPPRPRPRLQHAGGARLLPFALRPVARRLAPGGRRRGRPGARIAAGPPQPLRALPRAHRAVEGLRRPPEDPPRRRARERRGAAPGHGRAGGDGPARRALAGRAWIRHRGGEGGAARRGHRPDPPLAIREPLDGRAGVVDAGAPGGGGGGGRGGGGGGGAPPGGFPPGPGAPRGAPPAQADALGAQGRRYALGRFRPAAVGARLEDLVAAVAAPRRAAA